jgi:hypothetical protein
MLAIKKVRIGRCTEQVVIHIFLCMNVASGIAFFFESFTVGVMFAHRECDDMLQRIKNKKTNFFTQVSDHPHLHNFIVLHQIQNSV